MCGPVNMCACMCACVCVCLCVLHTCKNVQTVMKPLYSSCVHVDYTLSCPCVYLDTIYYSFGT